MQVLVLAREMGVLKLGTVALDGTKVHANASRHSALSHEHAGRVEAQPIDDEVGDLVGGSGLPKLLTYVRYDATLTSSGLAGLGLAGVKSRDVQRMDGVRNMTELTAIGQAVARSQVRAEHFTGFAP